MTPSEIEEHLANVAVRRARWNGDIAANDALRHTDGPTPKHYHLTREQHGTLIECCKPSRSIYAKPLNAAWRGLADELGFQWETVVRDGLGNSRYFYAVPTPGWKPMPIAREAVAAALAPTGPSADDRARIAEVEALIEDCLYAEAALLAASIADPILYAKYMRLAFAASRADPARSGARQPAVPRQEIHPMKHPKFELSGNSATLASYTPRRELHGEDRQPAATLRFSVALGAELLCMFAPTLRSSLYHTSEREGRDLAAQASVDADLRHPQIGAPLAWTLEIVGAELTIDHGLGGKSNIVLPACTVDAFTIEPKEGAIVVVCFRVACHPDEKQSGKLAMLIASEVTISLVPPAGDLVEQGAGDDKPLNTAGDAERASAAGKKGGRKAARAAAEAAFQ